MLHYPIKILYVQLRTFGDVLVSTMILRKLKEKYQNSIIDYYTTTDCVDLLIGNPIINTIYTEINPPYQAKYDVIFRPYKCLQEASGWHLSGKHWADLYAEVCGVDLQGKYIPEFYNIGEVKEEDRLNVHLILIQCKTRDNAKEWDRFTELVELLNKNNYLVKQIGEADESIVPGAYSLLGQTTFSESAAYMKSAITTVCLDSITQHLAGAIGASYISLHGPKPSSMVSTGDRHSKQLSIDPPSRNGCEKACHLAVCTKENKCINNIEPSQIFETIESWSF